MTIAEHVIYGANCKAYERDKACVCQRERVYSKTENGGVLTNEWCCMVMVPPEVGDVAAHHLASWQKFMSSETAWLEVYSSDIKRVCTVGELVQMQPWILAKEYLGRLECVSTSDDDKWLVKRNTGNRPGDAEFVKLLEECNKIDGFMGSWSKDDHVIRVVHLALSMIFQSKGVITEARDEFTSEVEPRCEKVFEWLAARPVSRQKWCDKHVEWMVEADYFNTSEVIDELDYWHSTTRTIIKGGYITQAEAIFDEVVKHLNEFGGGKNE